MKRGTVCRTPLPSAPRNWPLLLVLIPEDRKFIAVTGGGINDIGKEHFFSSEKLTTLLALFKYEGEFENALTMMQALFNVGGKGHSCGIYSFSDDHIHRLGMAAPVSRIMVRQPNNRGNAGSAWNGMPPTSSMGCGTWGGNIVSENITLKHYMNTTWVARPNRQGYAFQRKNFSVTSLNRAWTKNNKDLYRKPSWGKRLLHLRFLLLNLMQQKVTCSLLLHFYGSNLASKGKVKYHGTI